MWAKFQEEFAELEVAITHETGAEQEAELGDALFTLVNIGRWLGLDPVRALDGTNHRFSERWAWVEKHQTGQEAEWADFLRLWQQAKVAIAQAEASAPRKEAATHTVTAASAKLSERGEG